MWFRCLLPACVVLYCDCVVVLLFGGLISYFGINRLMYWRIVLLYWCLRLLNWFTVCVSCFGCFVVFVFVLSFVLIVVFVRWFVGFPRWLFWISGLLCLCLRLLLFVYYLFICGLVVCLLVVSCLISVDLDFWLFDFVWVFY